MAVTVTVAVVNGWLVGCLAVVATRQLGLRNRIINYSIKSVLD